MADLSHLYAEGNNGGDYCLIHSTQDGFLLLEIGHCCVVIFRAKIPVEVFCSIFGWLMTEHKYDYKAMATAILQYTDKEFRDKLVEKVEPIVTPLL